MKHIEASYQGYQGVYEAEIKFVLDIYQDDFDQEELQTCRLISLQIATPLSNQL